MGLRVDFCYELTFPNLDGYMALLVFATLKASLAWVPLKIFEEQ